MNNKQRKIIEKLLEQISDIKTVIEAIRDDEQEKFDNMPEGLQQSENGQKIEHAVSELEEAIDNLDNVEQNLNSASE